ncbi:olfactory receptor 4p4-like [Lynx pardinus]|uniref:Olfactory receptor n=1 Tax=Lynx pardinus TaxID=191816 RepID=A0A485NIQ6_LYNPA|nr:olfactory receptor 4p4-like [Lynx pardinus]
MGSQRNISEFILLGLSYNQNIQIFCFVFFLFCYVSILVGNLLILFSIRCSALFYQPMYYFLGHLSFMDICYTSCVTPKLIGDLLLARKTISYGNCMLQVFSLHFLGMIEIFILTVMAFDRYAAICKPLHYLLIMNRARCNLLVLAAWAGGAVHSFSQFSMIFQLPFCGPNEINHYYLTFVLLFGSYVVILFTLRHQSAEGRRKALSTCGSHITVVILFFGPSIFAYLRPPTTFPEDKIFALFYTIIAPMFNPLIYTLRNTEMKSVMRKVWFQMIFSGEKHN